MSNFLNQIRRENKSLGNNIIEIKKVIEKINQYHHDHYGKIVEMNIKHKFTEYGWSVQPAIEQFQTNIDNLGQINKKIIGNLDNKKISIYLFGKVSAGKSRIVNVILEQDIMPSGPSHTTSCFINIKKSTNSKHCIKYPNKKDIKMDRNMTVETVENKQMIVEQIPDIPQLKSRLKLLTVFDENRKAILETNETLELHLNIANNNILKDNVELFDCPGAGNLKEITDSIEKHSADADIFIFVMNHCLSEQEEAFFKSQLENKSLDIFILINRWDETDNDDEDLVTKSMATITNVCQQFLIKYQILNPSDRIYFISANELFDLKVKKSTVNKNKEAKKRTKNFETFLKTISLYIDKHDGKKLQNSHSLNEKETGKFIKICNKFIQDIFNLKNPEIMTSYINTKTDLTKLIDSIPKKCELKIADLTSLIEEAISVMITNENISDKQWCLDRFNECRKTLKKNLKSFQSSLSDELLEILKDKYRSPCSSLKSQDLRIQIRESEFKLGDVLLCISTVLPILNVVAFAIWHSWNKKRDRIKHISTLESAKKDMIKTINKEMKCINNHFVSNTTDIRSIYDKKIKLYEDYWKGMDGYVDKIRDIASGK